MNDQLEKILRGRIETLQATIKILEGDRNTLMETLKIKEERLRSRDKIIAEYKKKLDQQNEYCTCEPIDRELDREDGNYWCLNCGKEFLYEPENESDYDEDI